MKHLKIDEFKQNITDGSVVIDTRDAVEFTQGFVTGAIFIGLEGNFEEWAAALLPREKSIILIAPVGKEEVAEKKLFQIGFLKIEGFLQGGFDTWLKAGERVDMVIDIEPDELGMDLPFDNHIVVVDVRSFDEYSKSHVKDSMNLPLGEMNDVAQIADLEENQNLYIYSESGYRSVIAASLLKREGYYSVRNILGGFGNIQHEKSIPLQK
ncbi:MAG: rhodanese-like domain-containing protein [Ginsengibacter sp.]